MNPETTAGNRGIGGGRIETMTTTEVADYLGLASAGLWVPDTRPLR